jgi:hypothetical protein
MTPSESSPKPMRTTRSGIDLASFEDVKLFKDVATVPAVTSVQDALSRLGNDHAKLLSIIHGGLQAEAVKSANESDSDWLKFDQDGKETTEVFAGQLVSSEVLNPMVLNLSRYNPVNVIRGGKEVEITWDECQSREEKQAVKAATLEMIRTTPRLVTILQKKMTAVSAGAASE